VKKPFIKIFFCCFAINYCLAQSWGQKASFPGAPRYNSVGFSIGNKGYIGLGNYNLNEFNDFWEWDQTSNNWKQISNFPGVARILAAGFSIGYKGYVVTGYGGGTNTKELWEWNGDTASPTYNTWVKKTDFPGSFRVLAVAFSIGTKGYVGTGSYTNDFWEWDGDTMSATYNTWTKKADFGGGIRGWATGFSCGKMGYIGTGTDGSNYKKDFWEWDGDTASPTYNMWSQKADVPGGARSNAIGLSIGNRGYLGLGLDSTTFVNLSDFWEFNPSNNTWVQKTNFGGTGRQNTVGFVIGNKGYIGTGYDNTPTNDFWEYCDTCPALGFEEKYNESSFFMYPNPASNVLYMEWFPVQKNSEVALVDMLGKTWRYEEIKSKRTYFDLSDIPEGIYFVQIKTNGGILTKKIIVQR